MERLKFKPCDKCITGTYKNQELSPPRGYQVQGASRCNPSAIPCAQRGRTAKKLGAGKVPGGASLRCSCNKFIKWLTPGEVAKLEARLGGQR